MLHALCFMIIITMLSFLIKIKGIGLDILFPSLCLNCGKTLIHADEKADEHGYAKFLCAHGARERRARANLQERVAYPLDRLF